MAPTDPSPTLSHPPAPAAFPKTHLDVLPRELIYDILVHLSKPQITPFHTAWPGSRYARLSEPLLHATVVFDGHAVSLAQILAGFIARPETRFWARELVAVSRNEGDDNYKAEGKENIKDTERLSIQRALTQILPAAEAELMTASSFIIREPPPTALALQPGWVRRSLVTRLTRGELVPADRVRVLACLLPNVTRVELGLRGLCEWETGTTANTAYEWPGRVPAPPDVPVLGKVRDVMVRCGAETASPAVRPGELLWAFFLPKVRKVHGHIVRSAYPGTVVMDREPAVEQARWAMHGVSGVEVLHLTKAALSEAALEGLLRLPSKLRDFLFSFSLPYELINLRGTFDVRALARGLATQAGSLERVRVQGVPYEMLNVESADRLGSLRGFTKLRELEVEFWMLAGPGCRYFDRGQAEQAVAAQSVEDATVGLSELPPGLVRLRLTTTVCGSRMCEGLCELVRGHLGRLFECKRDWVPMLETLELVIDGIGIFKDQSDLKELEEELREMAESKGANIRLKVTDLHLKVTDTV